MSKMSRRFQRSVAALMIVLNFSGARVVIAGNACEKTRVFFAPSRSFRAVTKKVMRKECRKPGQRTLGQRKNRFQSHELQSLRTDNRLSPVDSFTPQSVALEFKSVKASPLYAWKLASDISPVQPPHLHSKK